jgi:hypothetical protein
MHTGKDQTFKTFFSTQSPGDGTPFKRGRESFYLTTPSNIGHHNYIILQLNL